MATIDPLTIRCTSLRAWGLVREWLLAECENKCQLCGNEEKELNIHHVNECGLDNHRENLVILCNSCHARVHSILSDKLQKLLFEAGLKKRLELNRKGIFLP